MTYQAKVIAGGKIVIPADLRRELGIKDGDSLVIERDDRDGLVLKTRAQVVKEVQARLREEMGPSTGSVVDELIAERRVQGERENREHEEWLRSARA